MPAGTDRQVFSRLRPWLFNLKLNESPARSVSENIVIRSDSLRAVTSAVAASDSQRLASWNPELNLTAPYDYLSTMMQTFRKRENGASFFHLQMENLVV